MPSPRNDHPYGVNPGDLEKLADNISMVLINKNIDFTQQSRKGLTMQLSAVEKNLRDFATRLRNGSIREENYKAHIHDPLINPIMGIELRHPDIAKLIKSEEITNLIEKITNSARYLPDTPKQKTTTPRMNDPVAPMSDSKVNPALSVIPKTTRAQPREMGEAATAASARKLAPPSGVEMRVRPKPKSKLESMSTVGLFGKSEAKPKAPETGFKPRGPKH